MHFEIIVANGSFPLVFKCTTMCEAFGCMESLKGGLLHDIGQQIDMDEIMKLLVAMKHGNATQCSNHWYTIRRASGEV